MLINNKKQLDKLSSAFTLIELLAVIVIVAVIALITVPLLLNVIDKSQKNAFVDSAYGIIEAGKLYYMENISGKELTSRIDFKVNDGKFVLEKDTTKELKFSGKMPKSGMLQVHANGDVAVAICDKDYCACKSITELKVTLKDSNCNINHETGEIGEDKAEDGAPVGTVISYMGKHVPDGYLTCDGSTYNINDYKYLADQIKNNFGSYNYFGGDGSTTFAVPDLRGEFLRGTGGGTRNTGSGSDVGKHQDATRHSMDFSFYNPNDIASFGAYIGNGVFDNYFNIGLDRNQDKNYGSSKGVIYAKDYNFSDYADDIGYDYTNKATVYTSRPTNTSVLYCIKYK